MNEFSGIPALVTFKSKANALDVLKSDLSADLVKFQNIVENMQKHLSKLKDVLKVVDATASDVSSKIVNLEDQMKQQLGPMFTQILSVVESNVEVTENKEELLSKEEEKFLAHIKTLLGKKTEGVIAIEEKETESVPEVSPASIEKEETQEEVSKSESESSLFKTEDNKPFPIESGSSQNTLSEPLEETPLEDEQTSEEKEANSSTVSNKSEIESDTSNVQESPVDEIPLEASNEEEKEETTPVLPRRPQRFNRVARTVPRSVDE